MSESNNKYFKPAGDLTATDLTTIDLTAADLVNGTKKEYFKPAGDLTATDLVYGIENDHVESTDGLTENSGIIEVGCRLVTPSQLEEMKNNGYHILEEVNCGPLVSIQFEKSLEGNKGKMIR